MWLLGSGEVVVWQLWCGVIRGGFNLGGGGDCKKMEEPSFSFAPALAPVPASAPVIHQSKIQRWRSLVSYPYLPYNRARIEFLEQL